MMAGLLRALLLVVAALWAMPAAAQITVLDQAQDDGGTVSPTCGTQPLTIARMGWPSAQLLAEIHARVLAQAYDCDTRVTPGDLAATASSMGSAGQPAVAPEMWVTRIADVWNSGIEAQMMRQAAPTYQESQFEGWFMPDHLAAAHPEILGVADLAAAVPTLAGGEKLRFISCPLDWACAVINRNLIAAWGLSDLVEIIEPANRFEMDQLIGEVVSRKQTALFYYWRPNAVLAQLSFVALDMGDYDAEAAKCLAQRVCPQPMPSAFASETVVVALAEWVFTDIPAIAGYFQRSSLPLEAMDAMLAQLNEPGATIEAVAQRFVREQDDLWRRWVDPAAP